MRVNYLVPPLVIETDLGNDPDDEIAIYWLLERRSVNLLILNPGTPEQFELAKEVRQNTKADFEIVKSRDCFRPLDKISNSGHFEVFIIAPPTGIGNYLKNRPHTNCSVFMQGGTLPGSKLVSYNIRADLSSFKHLLSKPVTFYSSEITGATKFKLENAEKFNKYIRKCFYKVFKSRHEKKLSDLVASQLYENEFVVSYINVGFNDSGRSFLSPCSKHRITE